MTKAFTKFNVSRWLQMSLMLLSIVVLVGVATVVHADQYDDQINALQNQNNTTQGLIDGLQNQASSYEGELSVINNEIAGVQAALAVNQTEQVTLQNQIQADQQKIATEKVLLGDVITSMYENGQLSTIEELATSNSLSDYVDQQENQTDIQNKLNILIHQITIDQENLQKQKNQLAVVVKTEQLQNSQLATDQSNQESLISYNQGQQDAYNAQIQSNQSQIATLRAEQIAANQRLVDEDGGRVITSGACGGGYPAQAINGFGASWGCDYPLDNTIDNWGMDNRECVSYTAWKVYQTYGYMPYWGGSGDANEWPGDAEAAGIPVGTTPKVGSVAIYMGGSGDPWGHAMWVVGVDGDTITVDQYNLYYDGNFYETTINGAGLTYIYFGS